MERWIPALVVLAVLASLVIGLEGMREDPSQTQADLAAQLDRIEARLDAMEESTASMDARVTVVTNEQEQVSRSMEQLSNRTEELAKRSPSGSSANLANADYETEEPASAEEAADQTDEFRTLLADVFSSNSPDVASKEYERFWELAREKGVIDGVIDELEDAISGDPRDVDARMELANVYVAKLLTVPSGPERGIWSTKAEAQWTEVASQDEDHWQAHFNMGNNLSYYPSFLNRQDDAIEWLEKSERILSRMPVDDEHTQNYLRLSLVHRAKGDTKNAQAALERGLERHPNDESLESALAALKGNE